MNKYRLRRLFTKQFLPALIGTILGSFVVVISSVDRQPLPLQRCSSLLERQEDVRDGIQIYSKNESLYEYDYSMNYKIVPFAFVRPNWAQNVSDVSVCIATHTSVNKMHSMAEFLLSWRSVASVAVFVDGKEVQIVQEFLGYLQFCFPDSLLSVSIHLVYSVERPPIEPSLLNGTVYNCSTEPKKFVDDIMESMGMVTDEKNQPRTLYPQNTLRNTAIRMCSTDWILPVDIDMIPQPSLAQRLEKFLALKENKKCKSCAFVLPTYEVQLPKNSNRSSDFVKRIPHTKEELLKLIERKSAIPFHSKIYQPNQAASQLAKWEKLSLSSKDEIHVAYAVNYSYGYEPVFVIKRGFPTFDEKFLGYGMTRNTQAYEMFISGYKFKLLDNAFLIHWGFQYYKSRPRWRAKQSDANYQRFKNWLLVKTITYDADPLNLIQKKVNQGRRKYIVIQK